MSQLLAILCYFSLLFIYAIAKRKKALTQQDFVIGGRSLNPWTTALAAHASDMSNWLFMAYPSMIFIHGGPHIWAALGLFLMMWVNWIVVAPRVRKETASKKSVTLSGYFEAKLGESWPAGRLATVCLLFIFYTIYVSVTLYGMGLLLQTLFPISYTTGVITGIALILPYMLIGGYLTLAQVDLIQGIFLLAVILFVPLYAMNNLGGISSVISAVQAEGKTFSLFAGENGPPIWMSLLLMIGWGLGYFGQPHILTKFMGIKDPNAIKASRRIGMSWQFLTLFAATLVGFVGIAAFQNSLADPEQVFIQLVYRYFSPFIAGIFLCAIIAAIINAVSSMLLVLSSTIAEDVYKRFINPNSSEKQQLRITRLASVASALVGMTIALLKFATLDQLVHFAWSGLGASFGPLLIASLYFKKFTSKGAWLGMLVGGGTAIICPLLTRSIPALVIAFPASLLTIFIASRATETARATGAEVN